MTTCSDCGFCQEKIDKIRNLAVDARARGAYEKARRYEEMLRKCDCVQNLPNEKDREYVRSVQKVLKSEDWGIDSKLELARDVQGLLIEWKLHQAPKQRSISILPLFPDICSDNCSYARHCGSYPANVGNKCVKKVEANRGIS